MPESFTTPAKDYIRKNWNKPLLKFLSKKLNSKLVYLGLPSPSAEDVKEWLEYIRIVIAFQCRKWGKPSDPNQSRKDVEELYKLLNEYERQSKLDNFIVYDGYLEEVVLRGSDNSPEQIYFTQTDAITIYNLDFCNQITEPIEYINNQGDIQIAYKFEAINKLLKFQEALHGDDKKFVFFLTVHSSYNGKLLEDFVSNPPSSYYRQKIKDLNVLDRKEKNPRIIRLFVIHQLEAYFKTCNFVPHFLPVIYYKGLNGTQLIHFTIFGANSKNNVGSAILFQNLEDFLNQKFLSFDNNNFTLLNSESINEVDFELKSTPSDFLVYSETYSKVWNQ